MNIRFFMYLWLTTYFISFVDCLKVSCNTINQNKLLLFDGNENYLQ